MPETPSSQQKLAAPAILPRRVLRVRGTSVTLIEEVRARAAQDLGVDVVFEVLDFPTCQHSAATDPDGYDIYEQCFHNLDIVWFWGALQPIQIERIGDWDRISSLAKLGGISKFAPQGFGDAPVRKLYVQPGGFLGPEPGQTISMLPTTYHMDSFGYDPRIFGAAGGAEASWAWLLDPRAKGRIAVVDEPAIGLFDLAMAVEAAGKMRFADLGNMTVAEIDRLMALLEDYRKQGYFHATWRNIHEANALLNARAVSVQSMWAPSYATLGGIEDEFAEAVPREGYRAWHGGASLSRHLAGAQLDLAYDYLNWWLSGWAGAVMARQGYYMSVPERVRAVLTPAEWDYWYEGLPAVRDLPGPDGSIVARAGARRRGGAWHERASRVAVWNTVIDEYNYAARAWRKFVRSIDGDPA